MLNYFRNNQIIKKAIIYDYFLGKKIYIVFLLMTLSAVLEGIGFISAIPLISIALGSEQDVMNLISSFGFSDNISSLFGNPFFIFSILLFFFVSKSIVIYIAFRWLAKLRGELLIKLKIDLFKKYSDLPFTIFSSQNTGEFINVVHEQVNRSNLAFQMFSLYISHLVFAVIYIFTAIIISVYFAIILAISGLILLLLFKIINEKVFSLSKLNANENGRLSSLLVQFFRLFKYLSATNQKNLLKSRIDKSIITMANYQIKTGYAEAIINSAREPLAIVFVGFAIYLEVSYFGHNIANTLVSVALLYRGVNALIGMQARWQNMLEFDGSTEFIKNEMDKNFEIDKTNDALELFNKNFSKIKLSNLNFSYGGENIFENVSINIKSNTTSAIVGRSGEGKSTLVDLIVGLIRPSSGKVLFDSQCLSAINLDSYHQKIGYVTQESVIFDGSILENITCFLGSSKNSKTTQKALDLLEMVEMRGFVESLPSGLDTLIGEGGLKLSGGERQRIQIARELYRDISILILDEATNAQDERLESNFLGLLSKLKSEMTILLITHRLDSVKIADNIFLVDKKSVKKIPLSDVRQSIIGN